MSGCIKALKERFESMLQRPYLKNPWFLTMYLEGFSAFLYKINVVEMLKVKMYSEIYGTDVMYRPDSNGNEKKLNSMDTEYFSNIHREIRLKYICSSLPDVKLNETSLALPT